MTDPNRGAEISETYPPNRESRVGAVALSLSARVRSMNTDEDRRRAEVSATYPPDSQRTVGAVALGYVRSMAEEPSDQGAQVRETYPPDADRRVGAVALSVYSRAASRELSGRAWVSRFPGSTSVSDLEPGFCRKIERFIAALREAGASVEINSTYRPPERAYLMHWAWKIGAADYDAQTVPAKSGVDIEWWHGNAEASKTAAREMMSAFGIERLRVAPALASRHTERKAIDMDISWSGELSIKNADGSTRRIASTPRDGANAELIEVGATYGAIHFSPPEKDKPHWSTDGR
jgi:hypothetical protein